MLVPLAIGGCGESASNAPAAGAPIGPAVPAADGFGAAAPGTVATGISPTTPAAAPGALPGNVAAPSSTAVTSTPAGELPGGAAVSIPTGTAGVAAGGAAADGTCNTPGLQLDGMMYSPGGTLLPFPCEPFHPTFNNPYAVRCIDAWSWYETQFPGDEFCILPPEPGKGIQVGVHPQGVQWYAQVSAGDLNGYQGVAGEFLMDPGDEEERNYITSTPNKEEIKYYRSNVRMRAGSHHMIVSGSSASGQQREAWARGAGGIGLGGGSTSLPGAQRPDENVPKTLDKPAEDKGLYSVVEADQDVTFNMHHFNSTEQTTLKEAWINLWFEEDATIRVRGIFGMPISQAISTFAQPGQVVDKHYSFPINTEMRVLQLFGHRHVWTTNFSAWVERSSGEQEIVYQSFDWFDQPTYRYDSITGNPTPAPEQLIDGGHSGALVLQPGERLHFNCHINYTDERAAEEEAPTPASIGSLRFANQAFEGEMCILFGSTAGEAIGTPAADTGPLPSFATID